MAHNALAAEPKCARMEPMGTQAKPDESAEVVSLSGSLQPLKDHFNSSKSKRRFLALLSPT